MIKSILFKGTIKGKGIVNFDSSDQRWILKERFPSERSALNHDNVKIAKHSFYKIGKTEEGKPIWERRLCISADCLRNAIFGDDFPFQNTAILHHEKLLVSVLATVPALLRGYMFAADGKPAIKRKSPLMITGAEQISNAMTHFEVGSMSGAKRTKTDEDGPGDTSFHYEEKAGEMEYAFEGALDLSELQFVSFSQYYDRLGMLPDYEVPYREALSKSLGSSVSGVEFLVKKGAVIRTPEEGIQLSQSQIVVLIEEFFKRLLSLNIRKSKGYAELSTLKIKYVRNPIQDTMNDEGGWKPVNQPIDAAPSASDIFVSYEQIPEQEAVELREVIDKNEKDNAAQKKEKAAAKKASSKKASQAKKS